MQVQRGHGSSEWYKEIKQILKETAEQMKESERRFDKQMGKLGNRLGEMVEYMVMPALLKEFRKFGYQFTQANPHSVIEDEENNIFMEIDITLENGDKVMIVEVKNKLTTGDITDHIDRMDKVRFRADRRGDKRTYLGAVAGIVMGKREKLFALKNGFYVVEPSGETFTVTAPEGTYSPREW